MVSFLRLDSLELGRGLLDEEGPPPPPTPPKNPPLNDVTRPLVRPSRLDCRKLANALSTSKNVNQQKKSKT